MMMRLQRGAALFTQFFLLWVILMSMAALVRPTMFTWYKPYVSPTLGIIMFGMGISLTTADFARVARMPKAVATGISAQFVVMPLLAFLLTRLFRLDDQIAVGIVLVGSCPGGTASNVISYLANADVALSVTLTACTTLMAIVLTPLWAGILGGQFVPVDGSALFLDVLKITFVPVALGLVVRRYAGKRVAVLEQFFPAISVLGICLIIAYVVGLSSDRIPQLIGVTGLVVVSHNVSGLALGYLAARIVKLPTKACRTIAIEVGMQNSGLAVVLATNHFGPVAALPSALFSVVHNVTGSALATFWRRRPVPNE